LLKAKEGQGVLKLYSSSLADDAFDHEDIHFYAKLI
jgi:hypothetical protein